MNLGWIIVRFMGSQVRIPKLRCKMVFDMMLDEIFVIFPNITDTKEMLHFPTIYPGYKVYFI